jgi:hypothetical protein
MNPRLAYLLLVALVFFSGCDNFDPYTDTQFAEGIEIAGTWLIENIDPNTGFGGSEDCTMELYEDVFTAVYTEAGTVIGTVLEYDNRENYMVFITTEHFEPSAVGFYMKISWSMRDSRHLRILGYTQETTQEAANASTNIFWGPTNYWVKQ